MNKYIARIAAGFLILLHFFKINFTMMLAGVAYALLTVASVYAFFTAFGWWMLMLFAIHGWLIWFIVRWTKSNPEGI